MQKLFGFVGMSVGSWAGWAIGASLSMSAALLLSLVGTGVGLYFARRIVRDYF